MSQWSAWQDSLSKRDAPRQTREMIPAPTAEVIQSSEVRDPKAATQMLSYTSLGVRQIPAWDADGAVREAYLSSVVVFACVRTRAAAFAGCPLRAVSPGQSFAPGKEVKNHQPDSALARLLGPAPGGPNPTMSARALWSNAILNRVVTGKIAWELEMPMGASAAKDDWQPTAVWPLVIKAFDAIPSEGGSQLFDFFRYGKSSDKKVLQPSQVFYSFVPSPDDMRQAFSPLQAARFDIAADVLQNVYDVALLRNDAMPAGVLVHAAFENAAEGRQWEQQFDSQHRGPQNANRIHHAEFEGGGDWAKEPPIQWIPMGVTSKDQMMLASHQEKAMKICMALSTPMSLLDASGRTFNNAGMEERTFWLDTMLPELHDIEDEINLKLAPRLGKEVAVFDTSHVAALQPPARFLAIKLDEAVDRKIITPGEARQEMGFPADQATDSQDPGATLIERAQTAAALVAAGWDAITAAEIAGIAEPANPEPPEVVLAAMLSKAGWDPAVVAQLIGGPKDTTPLAPPVTPAGPGAGQTAPMAAWAQSLSLVRELRHEATRTERRRAMWRAADAQTRAAEGAWVKGLKRLFARQRKTVLSRLDNRKARWAKRSPDDINPDDLFDPAFWSAEMQDAVSSLYESLYATAGARATGSVGLSFDLANPRVQAAIDARVSELASQVTGTTYDAIKGVISVGLSTGSDIPTIAEGIATVFDAADANRAELIARTETMSASNDGALAGYQQAADAGYLDGMGKTWLGTDDNRECEDCNALDGETVPFDEPFSDGSDAPPQHPDCRCALGSDQLDTTARSVLAEQARELLRAVAAGEFRTAELEVA